MKDIDFKEHVMFTFNVNGNEFDRLMDEFLGHFSGTLKEFVGRRHSELHKEGKKNPEIYRLITQEASARRFAAEPLTERQVRRILYG